MWRVYENETWRIRFNLDRYLDRRIPIKMRRPMNYEATVLKWFAIPYLILVSGRRYITDWVNFFIGKSLFSRLIRREVRKIITLAIIIVSALVIIIGKLCVR